MSRSKKKKHGKMGNDEKTTLGLGLFIFALGVLSVVIGVVRTNEIANAKEFNVVEMTVTSVSEQTRELSDSERRRVSEVEDNLGRKLNTGEYHYYIDSSSYYRADVETVIDGKKVKGKYYQSSSMKKGDKIETIVMTNKNGNYKVIDPIKYGNASYFVTGALAIIIGLGLMGMALIASKMK